MFSDVSLPALFGHVLALVHNPNNISTDLGTGHFTSGGTIANFEALIRAQSRAALWLGHNAALKEAGLVQSFSPSLAAHCGWIAFDAAAKQINQAAVQKLKISEWIMGVANPKVLADRLEKLNDGKEFLGPVLLVPENKHYSWKKGCRMLGLGAEALWPIQLDIHGSLSIDHLQELLDLALLNGRPVLAVVSVVGTTELGGIDPVGKVQDVLDRLKKERGIHIWHHVDAAFGGYFRTLDLEKSGALSLKSREALQAMARVDSVTLDPHKLGYVPYASGAFLTRDKRDYFFSTFDDAPYIDFDETQDRGPYTIEGSRSAAGAISTWMTAKTMELNPDGYGLLLERTARTAKELAVRLIESKLSVQIAPGCDTNILCFSCAKPGESISKSNKRTLKVFDRFSPKHSDSPFIVSKTSLRWKSYSVYLDHWTKAWGPERDAEEVVLIRMTMMNPFFTSQEMTVNFSDEFIKELSAVLNDLNTRAGSHL